MLNKKTANEFKLKLDDVCLSIKSSNNRFIEKLGETFIHTDSCQPDITLYVRFISKGENLEETIIHITVDVERWKEIKGQEAIDGYYCEQGRSIYVIFKEIAALFPRFYLLPLILRGYYNLKAKKEISNDLPNIFLHAAGIIRDKQGYIFAGPSGSGKTTVSQLSANRCVIVNDEMVLVSRIKGDYWVSGSPLKASIYNLDVKAPLKAIFMLQPGNHTSLRRIKGTKAISRLAPLLIFPSSDSLTKVEHIFRRIYIASVLISQLPCYEMQFEKNDRFWKYIECLL